MNLKNFICFKNKKEKDNQPDYRLSANFGTKEQPEYKEIGAGFIKGEGDKKFISFQLSKPYKDKPSYHIELDELTNDDLAQL